LSIRYTILKPNERVGGWKYRLDETLHWTFTYRPEMATQLDMAVACGGFVHITPTSMTVLPGYRWDGATGALDTATMIAPSCVHDPLCQMIRAGWPIKGNRANWVAAADEFRLAMQQVGIRPWRVTWAYAAVRYANGWRF
jgi:hypothetical protein